MTSYRVEWKQSAQKELRKLQRDLILRILNVVETLVEDPYPPGSRKLHGAEYTYRLRVGDYRIVYLVYSDLRKIEIVKIGHRKDVYRRVD